MWTTASMSQVTMQINLELARFRIDNDRLILGHLPLVLLHGHVAVHLAVVLLL